MNELIKKPGSPLLLPVRIHCSHHVTGCGIYRGVEPLAAFKLKAANGRLRLMMVLTANILAGKKLYNAL